MIDLGHKSQLHLLNALRAEDVRVEASADKSEKNVVDGLIARGSCPRKLRGVMAGDKALASDWVASKLMSFNPKTSPTLPWARRSSWCETGSIKVIEDGVTVAQIEKLFPHYSHRMHQISWGLQLKLLKFYASVSGDVLPPILAQ